MRDFKQADGMSRANKGRGLGGKILLFQMQISHRLSLLEVWLLSPPSVVPSSLSLVSHLPN